MKKNHLLIKLSLLFCVFIASSFRDDNSFDTETNYLKISIDSKGSIQSLLAKETGKEYFPEDQPSPILSLYKKINLYPS